MALMDKGYSLTAFFGSDKGLDDSFFQAECP